MQHDRHAKHRIYRGCHAGDRRLAFGHAGSKGAATKDDFNTSLFNDARIVYVSGTMLADIKKNAKFEELKPIIDPDANNNGGSGSEDRPEIE